ncbi:MAG: LamG-like jellyroll fold domain-containing protein [Myxococcota bacterium]
MILAMAACDPGADEDASGTTAVDPSGEATHASTSDPQDLPTSASGAAEDVGDSTGDEPSPDPDPSESTGDEPVDPPVGCDEITLPQGDLLVHLDAAEGIELSGQSVEQWTNLADPATSFGSQGNPPEWVEGALGGEPAVRFDGNGQRLFSSIDINGIEEMTFALVSATTRLWYPGSEWCQDNFGLELYEQGCSGTYNTPMMWVESGSWGHTFLGPGQEWISYRFGTGGTAYSDLENDPDVAALNYDPRVVWRRPSSIGDAFTRTVAVKYPQDFAVLVDGELVYENSLPDGTGPLANNSSAVHLGAGRGDRYWGGEIAMALVYTRALSDEELAALDMYFECRFFGN